MSAISHMRGLADIVGELQRRMLALLIEGQIPAGTNYGAGGFVTLDVRQGQTYLYVAGANEVSCLNGADAVASGERFVASGISLIINGVAGNVPVTAQVSVVAFDRVELFDTEDLNAAFQFLLVTEQRVCVIVPLQAKFDEVFGGTAGPASRKLTQKRVAELVVLCSDRVLGDRKAALWGSDSEFGAMAIAEMALPQCVGLLLPNVAGPPPISGVVGEVLNYGVVTIRDDQDTTQSRLAVAIELDCRGGYLEADLGRSPVL